MPRSEQAPGCWRRTGCTGAWASCKGAVKVLSRCVAKEYGPRGIRSNTVAPGSVATDSNNGAIRSNPKLQEMVVARTTMGRLAEPHDIGGLVTLLCSDDARWLTGQRLEATGGLNIRDMIASCRCCAASSVPCSMTRVLPTSTPDAATGPASPEKAKHDLFACIKGFCNQRRLHPALGYLIPVQTEGRADRVA